VQEQRMEILSQQSAIAQLNAAISGEEKERKRIGQELHDGISGMLTAINMNIAAIQRRHGDMPAAKELGGIIKMVQAAAIEVRKTAHNLAPGYLLENGLSNALLLFSSQINSGGSFKVSTECFGNMDDLDKKFVLMVYRIIQELVNNVIKHAEASHAAIQVRRYDNILGIMVEDNGKGFNTETSVKGMGLTHILSRIDAVKGYISIDSRPLHGTTIHIEFDLEKISPAFL
jgi:two-component system, NarL family, sensor kinase